jgi:hypothetical protein
LTVGPASRVILALAGLLADAHQAGALHPPDGPVPSEPMAAEARRLRELALPDVPTAVVARGLVAWTQLFGQISFELFGQLEGVVGDAEVVFEYAISVMADVTGLRAPDPAPTPDTH